jgi:hypothetical protein
MGGRDGTMHPTFFGIIYADGLSFYMAWVLFVIAIMRLSDRVLNTLPSGFDIYFWGILLYVSVMWARGSIYAPVVVSVVSLTFLMLLLLIKRKKFRLKFY